MYMESTVVVEISVLGMSPYLEVMAVHGVRQETMLVPDTTVVSSEQCALCTDQRSTLCYTMVFKASLHQLLCIKFNFYLMSSHIY